jgi:hypothetical protein
MTLRLTPRALAEAKRIKTWWRRNRSEAPEAPLLHVPHPAP